MTGKWKPKREGGNPLCKHYSSSPRVGGDEPFICTHTGESCYRQGHPVDECLDCGLTPPKEVVGKCKCGGAIVLWTTGVCFIGGGDVFTEKCVSCGQESHRTPTKAEVKAHDVAHFASDAQRYECMKANLAKFRR